VDIRENRVLRSNDRVTFNGTVRSEAQAPAQLDCHYLLTAWSAGQTGQDGENVATEHRLLYTAAAVLLRHNPIIARRVFGNIPKDMDALNDNDPNFLSTVTANDPDTTLSDFYSLDPVLRDTALQLDVMPPEGYHRIGEFWGLMGANAIWHPSAYVIITIPVERHRTVAGPPVRSIGAIYDRGVPTSLETLFTIGGTVSTATGRPVQRVPATMSRQQVDPTTGATRQFIETALTDDQGQFTFTRVPAGIVQLSAQGNTKVNVNVPPKSTGEYDLTAPAP
jgi:Pvc16 N-terminal domain